MLPRELVEELIGGSGSASLHVLVALPDAFDGLLIVLTLPFEVVRQDVVKSISGALSAPTRELLELHQSFGFYRQRFHVTPRDCKQYPMTSRLAPEERWRGTSEVHG